MGRGLESERDSSDASKSFFGAVKDSDEQEAMRCRKAMREFFYFSGLFVVWDAIPFLGWLDLGGHEKAMKKTAKELDSIMEEWLEEHRRKKESFEEESKGDQDFIDVLLSVLEGLDLSGYDPLTLLVGGTYTVIVTITWTLALLMNNRYVLEKTQEELDTQIGKGRLVNESDINKLVYLQAIVKESLRLYPAGTLAGAREFSEDCTVGRRSCPGISFGLQMTHLVLATFLHGFDILNPSNEPVDMTGSPGLTNIKATPLEVLVKPCLSPSLYR
ncbi:Cytochrome P450 [Hibiscus syriacus]|uniref:Cytochrome P450 n=1 Tax=Hibiscus syriacus TaxID=106335 RepID=A0A6A2Y3N1_HIBSY|nr:Cytochrome P450 [Hibiscus syriacus]